MPGWLAYLIVFVATVLENVFPPTPSDLIVALAGFLSHHSITNPFIVFLCAWSGGVLTAGGVYAVSRRHGRQFFAGRLGRRLLPASAVAAMEREYRRFGTAGLFLARLIPGVRTFVAPFAGLVDLPPGRVMVPIALASGVWYAALTWAGVALGAEWDRIVRFIGQLNIGLGIFGAVVVIAIVAWRLTARKRNAKAGLPAALAGGLTAESGDRAATATAALEIACDAPDLGAVDLAEIERVLQPLTKPAGTAPAMSEFGLAARTSQEAASLIATNYSLEQRRRLLTAITTLLDEAPTLRPYQSTIVAHAERLLIAEPPGD